MRRVTAMAAVLLCSMLSMAGCGEATVATDGERLSPATNESAVLVGKPCVQNEDCGRWMGAQLRCLDAWPGGYCTLSCSFENTMCPPGTLCRSLAGEVVCLEGCFDDGDCPREGYHCHDSSRGSTCWFAP